MSKIEFTVNGKLCKVDECVPRYTSLNAYLRYVCCLPGTKAMCREGGCGACIVTVRAKRYPSEKIETFSVNSCLVLVFSCNGWEITTVEGVGNRLDGYSDIQKRIAAFHGTQCGYCTPGWVMHINSLKDKNLTMAELEKSFGSNTCRCTGFRSILETIKTFAIDAPPELCQRVEDIEDTPSCKNNCQRKCSINSDCSDWSLLEEIRGNKVIELHFGKCHFYKVFEECDIFEVFKKHGLDSYMLVDGNTGKGIIENFEYPRVLIEISEMPTLKRYTFDQNLVLGANISLEDSITIFKETAKSNSDFAYLAEFVKHFELIAHLPVRKIGSLAGNLMYKRAYPKYQSDVFLLMESVGATITVRKCDGETETLSVLGFLKYNMQGVLMVNIQLPPRSDDTHIFRSYKIMPRSQNALAIVNSAFLIKLNRRNNTVEDARILFGNIAPDFTHAYKTEIYLKGKKIYSNATLKAAIRVLTNELVPIDNPPEPSPSCRKKLAIGLFYKFILNITPSEQIQQSYRTGGNIFTRPVSQGKPDYQTDPSLYPINQPMQKLEAIIQCSGEARYVNDLPPQPREVFGAFVMSTVHGGEVDTIYKKEILEIEGVIAIYTSKDIPGINSFILPGLQLETETEEILATTIKFFGQPVAIVVAETEELATCVAKKVRITYKNVNTKAPILSIDDAKKNSERYITGEGSIEPDGRGINIKKIINGVYEMKGQYHYYMEPLTAVVVPVDQGFDVYDSTQWMDLTQNAVAQCLGINESSITIRLHRIGGGFGGKISRNGQVVSACALVAYKLNRPCRFILPLQTNLAIAGGRLPNQCQYEVGVDDDGKIQYLEATIVEDEGYSNNENVTGFTAPAFKNCYDASYFSLKTATVLTDTASNTWARAPGACEGIASIEHIMERIAFEVQKDPTEVRLLNMRTDDNDIPEMIETMKKDVDYENRRKEIEQFNRSNRWIKRAININVMSFPVVYYGNYTALVSIYRGDGTVTITTAGIEMGQGANTKAAQVCARQLGIPIEYVHVLPNYSFTAANMVFSGSSITTESVCYSIIKACEILKSRLEVVRAEMPDASWLSVVKRAGEMEIELSASYMMSDKEDELKPYYAFAVTILEIELDVITGKFQVLRVDILEDAGLSVNPAVDIGQIEGAFIQGLGLFTCEELVHDKETGKLFTNRSLNYHVPLCQDIPIVYNVHLRYNSKNPNGVLGAKTCGEMGICTAHGVTLALRDCIMASRKDSGYNVREWIDIALPCTTENILNALAVKIEEFVLNKCKTDAFIL